MHPADRIVVRACGVAALALAMILAQERCAAETVVGAHLGSHHWSDAPRNNVNPGAYVRLESGLTVGAYRNSFYRPTLYVGMSWAIPGTPIDVTAALATGYDGHPYSSPVTVLLVPSIASPWLGDWRVRLSAVPRLSRNQDGIAHLSIESRF